MFRVRNAKPIATNATVLITLAAAWAVYDHFGTVPAAAALLVGGAVVALMARMMRR